MYIIDLYSSWIIASSEEMNSFNLIIFWMYNYNILTPGESICSFIALISREAFKLSD